MCRMFFVGLKVRPPKRDFGGCQTKVWPTI